MSDPAEPSRPGDYLEVLVAQALDDLEEGRIDPETALRMVARFAWDAGRRFERENP